MTTNLNFIDPALAQTRQARLKLARKARGMRSKDVAEHLGVSPPAVTKWENDQVPEDQAGITIDKLQALCRLYKVNLEWVVNGTLPVESANEAQQELDAFQAMLASRLHKMAESPSPQGLAAFTNLQALLLSQLVEECVNQEERELLVLYAKAKELSHLPGYEFMLIAMKAAMNSFLASNPTRASLQVVTSQA